MVGKTKRRERAYRKAQAMKRKAQLTKALTPVEREGAMDFKETKNGYNYYFDAEQSKGGWIINVSTDVKLQVGGAFEVTREEFNKLHEEAIDQLLALGHLHARGDPGVPAVARLPMFSFFVRQDHVPRWGIDVEDMARLEQFTDTVIALLPDTVRIREFLGEDFIE